MEPKALFECLQAGVSPFHCVEAAKKRLLAAGFEELNYAEGWMLVPGGRYVMEHHGTTLFAFTVGEAYQPGDMLRMAAAHTDYPCLRLKPHADFFTNGYAQVNVEVYGGPILNTWLDRPLGVAGRIMLKSEDPFRPKAVLYRSARPVMIIPNLAIHMNREVNKGVELNRQVDLMPVLDMIPEEMRGTDYFLSFIAEELSVEKTDILDFELNTFCMEEPCLLGPKQTLLSSPRLDNQTSVHALLNAMIHGNSPKGIRLIALFDHEEIGNKSKQGAASILLRDLVRRIAKNLGQNEEQMEQTVYNAMLLSVDVAHALHPNKPGKMDITNHPVLGGGFCIKAACSQSYATDAEAISILRQICEREGIPYQHFVNRSDVTGGGTLGSVASTLLPVRTVDIGIPLLSMHSVRELMGTSDIESLTAAVTAFFRL